LCVCVANVNGDWLTATAFRALSSICAIPMSVGVFKG